MTVQAITNQLPVFTGTNGLPLTGGYVYVGEPNTDPRTNPIAVYWDEALTLAAQQPLRTTAGYVYRNGAPASIWADGSYSVMVLDANSRQVFYAAQWSDRISNAIQQVESVSALRALDAPASDSTRLLTGYASLADGGSGVVAWDSTSVTDDDGGMIFKPTSNPASGRWKRLTSWEVTPEKFASLQAALDGAYNYERTLCLEPRKVYTLTAPLIQPGPVDIIGNNAVLDMSGLGATDYGLTVQGSNASTINLAANAAAGATSLTLASVTGIAAGSWLFLRSTAVFAVAEGVTYGEFVRVLSLPGGNVVNLYAPTSYAFNTANAAAVDVLSLVGSFTWQDFTIVGSGTNSQNGALLDRVEGAALRNVNTDKCNARGVALRRSFGVNVHGGRFQRANLAGVSYGIIVYDGCLGVSIDGVVGYDLRHTVTVGGVNGVNRAISVSNSKALASRDAGFDCHSAGDGIQYSTLYVECGATALDALVMQGINYTVETVDVRNVARNGVFAQWLPSAAGSGTIRGVRGLVSQALVSVEANGGDINAVTIEDIQGAGDAYQVLVQASNGHYVKKATTRGVKTTTKQLVSRGIRYFANGAGTLISGGSISDVQIEMAGGASEAVYVHGSTGTVEGITVDDLKISGGSNNVRFLGANDCVLGRKLNLSGATAAAVSWGAGTGNRGGSFIGSATYDPPSLAAGATQTTTVTVTGAAVGDAVTSIAFSVANASITWTGSVTAADTVTVTMRNNSGGAIDLASGTLRVETSRLG